jgi:hypothetical protein
MTKTKKVKKRSSVSATKFKVGTRKLGNDNNAINRCQKILSKKLKKKAIKNIIQKTKHNKAKPIKPPLRRVRRNSQWLPKLIKDVEKAKKNLLKIEAKHKYVGEILYKDVAEAQYKLFKAEEKVNKYKQNTHTIS